MSEQWFIKEMETKPKCKEVVQDLRYSLSMLCNKELLDILLVRNESVTFVYTYGNIIITRAKGIKISSPFVEGNIKSFTTEFNREEFFALYKFQQLIGQEHVNFVIEEWHRIKEETKKNNDIFKGLESELKNLKNELEDFNERLKALDSHFKKHI